MASAPLTAVSRLTLRCYLASAWLFVDPALDGRRSRIVIAPHQSALDVSAAVLVSGALDRRFAVWAHPDILRVAPFLRSEDFLDAPTDPEGFRQLVHRSRALLRSDEPTDLWVFPQGGFFPRATEPVVHPGFGALRRACADVPIAVAGIDYSLYRTGRPHCVVDLAPLDDVGATIADVLVDATRRAAERAASCLPGISPPKLPLTELAGIANRWRRPWTHVRSER